MSRKGVARALQAMDDESSRALLAAGTREVFADYDLDDYEGPLVRAAATAYPDVEGFSLDAFVRNAPLDLIGPAGPPTREGPDVTGFAAQRFDPYRNFKFRIALGARDALVPDAYIDAVRYAGIGGAESNPHPIS